MISPAARWAMRLYDELHPDTAYTPDPDQGRLALLEPPAEEPEE